MKCKTITHDTSCWVVTEGIAGTENQCLGLAEALGLTPTIKHTVMRAPWSWFCPPVTYGAASYGASSHSDPIESPWPDIAICSGRQSIAAALRIKQQSHGQTFVVQIQDPRCNPSLFDMVILPNHDPTRGDNVVTTTGMLNRITDQTLQTESEKWQNHFNHLPQPLIAVLIGGNSKAHSMTADTTHTLCHQLLELANAGHGLLITASRRTGQQNQHILQDKLADHPHIFLWDGTGKNPYFGFLGLADTILVTNDSVSMISESLTTSKPTYIISLKGGGRRIDLFHKTILEQDLVRPFTGLIEPWKKTSLRETERVAQIVAQAYENR